MSPCSLLLAADQRPSSILRLTGDWAVSSRRFHEWSCCACSHPRFHGACPGVSWGRPLGCGRTEVSPLHDSEGPSTSLSAHKLGFLSKRNPRARWECNYTSPSHYHGMTVAGTNPERKTRRRRSVDCWDEAILTGLRARGVPGAY